RCLKIRHSAVTRTLFPTEEAVPWTINVLAGMATRILCDSQVKILIGIAPRIKRIAWNKIADAGFYIFVQLHFHTQQILDVRLVEHLTNRAEGAQRAGAQQQDLVGKQ